MTTITRKNGRTYTTKADKNRFFFPGEWIKTYKALKKKQQHTALCQLNTGARINELRHVKVEDIYLDNKRLILKVTKTKALKGEKKGRPRLIPISTKFTKYLSKYIRQNKLQPQNTINILSTAAFNTGLKKAVAKAGIQSPNDFSSHNLRKTLETWLMALGVADMALTAHIGHDIRTAASHYVSPSIFTHDEKNIICEIIDDLYADMRRWR